MLQANKINFGVIIYSIVELKFLIALDYVILVYNYAKKFCSSNKIYDSTFDLKYHKFGSMSCLETVANGLSLKCYLKNLKFQKIFYTVGFIVK